MEGLSFGEQVKIILSRKNMTIKELAELIQERTGKAMSRQNLTQRLGRDNFQEKDMRMIAAILDCPFRLSIFPTDPAEDEKIMQYANAGTYHKRGKRKKEEEEDVYQQTLVFDEEPETEAVEAMPIEVQEQTVGDERDMTIGELYEIHEELKELEEESAEMKHEESPAEEGYIKEGDVAEEVHPEAVAGEPEEPEVAAEVSVPIEKTPEEVEVQPETESVKEAAAEEIAEPEREKTATEEKTVEEKKDIFHTGGIFLRRMRRNNDDKKTERKTEEQKPVEKKPAREVITPDSEDFEPVIKHVDAEEDLSVGEMNPYTGREYQTNSVRMHPSRIGYVQVYDRKQHQWTDMTEWAFLGYQERKKALLGKDYEPPIYLD
jgi:transcriptional regulator with XRE-family HTH domain